MNTGDINTKEKKAIERAKRNLIQEGYKKMYEWFDLANTIYEEHQHTYAVKLVIIAGSMGVFVGGEDHFLLPTHTLYMSKNSKHSVKVGEGGCLYVVGERNRMDC